MKERVQRLEQLLLIIAPEQAKAMLEMDPSQDQQTYMQVSTSSGLPAIKQSDSDLEDEDEDGEDGGEAEKAAFALESIAVAGRPPTVGLQPRQSMTRLTVA